MKQINLEDEIILGEYKTDISTNEIAICSTRLAEQLPKEFKEQYSLEVKDDLMDGINVYIRLTCSAKQDNFKPQEFLSSKGFKTRELNTKELVQSFGKNQVETLKQKIWYWDAFFSRSQPLVARSKRLYTG